MKYVSDSNTGSWMLVAIFDPTSGNVTDETLCGATVAEGLVGLPVETPVDRTKKANLVFKLGTELEDATYQPSPDGWEITAFRYCEWQPGETAPPPDGPWFILEPLGDYRDLNGEGCAIAQYPSPPQKESFSFQCYGTNSKEPPFAPDGDKRQLSVWDRAAVGTSFWYVVEWITPEGEFFVCDPRIKNDAGVGEPPPKR